jgi:signal transduction histidine kinase
MVEGLLHRPVPSGATGMTGMTGVAVHVSSVRRLCAAAAVAYRLLSTVTAAILWLDDPVPAHPAIMLVLTGYAAYNVVALRRTLTDDAFARFAAWPNVAVDVMAAAMCTVLLTGLVPDGQPDRLAGWGNVVATIAVWTVAKGWRVGVGLALLSAPLTLVTAWATGLLPGPVSWSILLTGTAQCVVALVGVAVLQPAVWAELARWARTVMRAERTVQWNRAGRVLHDTAVQTLDAIQLLAASTPPDAAAETLRRVGELARQEMGALRAAWDAAGPAGAAAGPRSRRSDLVLALTAAVRAAESRGLTVLLIGADQDGPSPSPERVLALRWAVTEALTNTAKHAGVCHATVRIVRPATEPGLEVVVSDRGRGLGAAPPEEGFGLRQSVRGRLAEVGGAASVASGPGGGVTVRLWVPV